ncbi:hypothetical protein [Kribbella sp. CA-293567]|uniref:hypothetical protein n=1 Tax=Kribbella sp. CA-293567 TaxID=3002436 RepID=UPI0022DE49E4|nr:hypothetical protein [Kribbella sp. CA-293567]WBQ08640.1 hypothetical protein OX958_17570 [Kribbella sp. CA-293567]
MNVKLSPSQWTVPEARSLIAQLRQLAEGEAYDGIELFTALCGYLDELYGGAGFDQLLPEPERAELGAAIQRVLGKARTGSVLLDDDGVPVDLATPDADPVYDTLVRLDQPVNAAVTLAQGRGLAAELAGAEDWQGELGRALQGLYSYLDQLHGGPGAFAELLGPDERNHVAQRAPKR